MNIEDFREYCLSMEGVTEKTPFGRFARRYDSLLVFYVLDHMFCFVDMDDFTSVNIRSVPDEIDTLRATFSAVGAPLNRTLRYWVSIDLGGDVSEARILELVTRAYEIVKTLHTPKDKRKPCVK